jgi:hypothetical protein
VRLRPQQAAQTRSLESAQVSSPAAWLCDSAAQLDPLFTRPISTIGSPQPVTGYIVKAVIDKYTEDYSEGVS